MTTKSPQRLFTAANDKWAFAQSFSGLSPVHHRPKAARTRTKRVDVRHRQHRAA